MRNAISLARKTAAESGKPIFTYGPLIHNQQVIEELSADGVRELPAGRAIVPGDTVLIRAHGVGPAVYGQLAAQGACIVDATCPNVKRIHNIVSGITGEGQALLILGDAAHPEVEGIIGWARVPYYVIAGPEEAEDIALGEDLSYHLVAQTTFNQFKFKKTVELLRRKVYNLTQYSTICNSTSNHQEEALCLAEKSDVMLVLGSSMSSNTRKLYELCSSRCADTFLLESARDLQKIFYRSAKTSVAVGITAGASTPDYFIQEVVNEMSEANFEELLNESLVNVRTGDIVTGTVMQVMEGEIVLNIGCKCDGTMTKSEFGGTDAPLTEQVNVGDEIEVKVIKKGDQEVLLSRRRLLESRAYNELKAAEENKTVLTGKVVEAIADKGLIVDYNGNRIFIPGSRVDTKRVEDLSVFVGQDVNFRIIPSKNRRDGFCGDRKGVIGAERAAKREEALAKIEVGQRYNGIVRNVTNYCAFIDLGGVDGMLHLSEMGWKGVRHPGQYCKEGQEIEVLVKAFDPETKRISLTTKFPEANPWEGAAEKYAVGNVVKGKVVRFSDFGAFVELEKDIDALIHISHLSRKFVKNPAEVLTIGQEVEAEVIDFDADRNRISLSLKALEPEEAPAEEAPAEEAPAEAPAEE